MRAEGKRVVTTPKPCQLFVGRVMGPSLGRRERLKAVVESGSWSSGQDEGLAE